jgi:zinc transporter 2
MGGQRARPKTVKPEDVEKGEAAEADAENLNVRAAVIHMLGDMITSAGVILAAVIIYFKPEYKIADPLITFVFSVIVLFTTLPVMNDSMRILLEGSPEEIDQVKVYNAINAVSISNL